MTGKAGWWRSMFESVSSARARCLSCAEEMDTRGNRPQKHLADAHGLGPPDGGTEEEEEESATAPPDAPAPFAARTPEEADVERLLKGLSRENRLRHLLDLAEDDTAAVRDKVAAEGLIAKYQGWLDSPPEEDEEESRLRHVKRFEKAIASKKGLEEKFRRLVRDRELRAWMLRQFVTSSEEVEWARNLLDLIEREALAPQP